MRTKLLFFSLPLFAAFGYLINSSYQGTPGPHGGVVKSAENHNIEVKTMYPFIYSYLLDGKNNPVKNKGISCEIKFLLPDETNIDIQLKPYKDDGFMMESGSMVYNSMRVNFNVLGKSVSAVFENESAIVQKIQQGK